MESFGNNSGKLSLNRLLDVEHLYIKIWLKLNNSELTVAASTSGWFCGKLRVRWKLMLNEVFVPSICVRAILAFSKPCSIEGH